MVVHCHCNVKDQLEGSRGEIWALKSMGRNASKLFVLNKASLEWMEKLNPGKTRIIPNFIEKEKVTEKNCVREKVRRAVFVGHVQREKGIKELCAAAEKMPDILFDIVGPVSAEMQQLMHGANIFVRGGVQAEEVGKLLKKADLFILPTYSEGFSMALLEAMAAGLPVITTDAEIGRASCRERV